MEDQITPNEKKRLAGKLGHEARMKKYGKEYYSALGKRSAASRKAKKQGLVQAEEVKNSIPLAKAKKGFIPTLSSFLNGNTS